MCLQILTTFALLVTIAGTVQPDCPVGCICGTTDIDCEGAGITQVPDGHWPDIRDIVLTANNISTLHVGSFAGFPNAFWLFMDENPLTELNMGAFDGLNKLAYLSVQSCAINSITPTLLPNLHTLDVGGNKLTILPENFLSYFPRISHLDLSFNPWVISDLRLSSESVDVLTLDGVNASDVTSLTFKGLPRLKVISLSKTDMVDLSDRFAYIAELNSLYLHDNPLKAIRKGSFSTGQVIYQLSFTGSQLEILDVEAVDELVVSRIIISDTPMACDCKYEQLLWWAVGKKVQLQVECSKNILPCEFTKKQTIP